jgi:hypothetical protein
MGYQNWQYGRMRKAGHVFIHSPSTSNFSKVQLAVQFHTRVLLVPSKCIIAEAEFGLKREQTRQ